MSAGSFLYTLAVGLCSGIALSFLLGAAVWFAVLCICLAASGILLARIGVRPRQFLLCAVVCVSIALGIVRSNIFLWGESQDTLLRYSGATAVIDGKVTNDPERRKNTLQAVIEVSSINGKDARGSLLAQLPRDEKLEFGDHVSIRANIERPESFDALGGREFDYPNYLRVRGISAIGRHAAIISLSGGRVSLQRFLFSIKHTFEASLERVFQEPQGSLLEGVLLGERRALPDALTDAFIASGLIHVVVLSGYNISIVSEAVLRLLYFIPRSLGLATGGTMMIFFAMMTGAGATTARATIMALIAICARYFDRPAMALRSLAAAVCAMVAWNPLSLLYDPSFILSVLATVGLIMFSPRIEARLSLFWPFRFGRSETVRSIAASTLAVQLFVLPALLYFTGVLSLLSLPANVLALPVVSFAMLFGFLAGIFGLVHPLFAFVPALLSDILLRWMIYVAETAAATPFGSVVVPAFPVWVVLLCYLPLSLVAIRMYTKGPRMH